jgi:hypothetical protein
VAECSFYRGGEREKEGLTLATWSKEKEEGPSRRQGVAIALGQRERATLPACSAAREDRGRGLRLEKTATWGGLGGGTHPII